MQLFLVRHGDYVQDSGGVDVLSPAGEKDVQKMADFLKHGRFHVREIWHSPKNRAAQTAGIFHKRLNPSAQIKEIAYLKPDDPVEPLLGELAAATENLMIVGHLPFIPRLVSRLLTGVTDYSLLALPTAGVVVLESDRDFNWFLTGFFHPQNI